MRRFIVSVAAMVFTVLPSVVGHGAAIVIEAESGIVLHDQESDYRHYPASLTKIMTVYLAFEAIQRGALKLSDKLPVSAVAAGQGGTKLRLRRGETISVEDTILATIVRSANDAAVVLAERIAESEAAFATEMTAKARSLGLTRTDFRNATGLPHAQQWSTARDMARLARALIRNFPQHYHFFGQKTFKFRGRSLPTYNGLLTRFRGADGIKTGFTCASGYNLVASANRAGRRLIAVLLGSKSGVERTRQMASLLTAAFTRVPDASASIDDLEPTAPELQLPVDLGASIESCDGLTFASVTRDRAPPLPANKPTANLQPDSARWAIEIGAFASQQRAQAVVERVLRRRAGGSGFVRPGVIGGSARFVAGIRGLEAEGALSLCKKRHDRGRACRVVEPAGTQPGASG